MTGYYVVPCHSSNRARGPSTGIRKFETANFKTLPAAGSLVGRSLGTFKLGRPASPFKFNLKFPAWPGLGSCSGH